MTIDKRINQTVNSAVAPNLIKYQAVVYKGHTLGVLGKNSAGTQIIEVMCTNANSPSAVRAGENIYKPSNDDYRLATLSDFQEYRVVHSESFIVA
jgi:hypothetical protein